MILPILMLAAAQTAASPPAPRPGRAFMSPMGEPVFGRVQNEDGLVAWFADADTNHDNVLTPEEMAADAQHFFEHLDVDQDGEIGPEEIERYETQIAPQVRIRYDMQSDAGNAGSTAEMVAGRYGLLQIPEPVMSADANFNRGVSAAEFQNAAIARFQLLDFSHSGRLTLAQLQSVRQAAITASRRRSVQPNTDSTQGQGIGQSVVPPDEQ